MKVIFAMLLVMGILFVSVLWVELPMKNYCNNLKVGSDIVEALKLAKKKDFFVHDEIVTKRKGTIVINNHMAPFFRIGCFIEVLEGKIVSSEIYATD